MAGEERETIEPLIEELLGVLDRESPGVRSRLSVQQAVSRLMFESYRRGLRKARRSHPSGIGHDRVVLPPDE